MGAGDVFPFQGLNFAQAASGQQQQHEGSDHIFRKLARLQSGKKNLAKARLLFVAQIALFFDLFVFLEAARRVGAFGP